jgi:hypothetical protein
MRKPYVNFSRVVAAPVAAPKQTVWTIFKDGRLHGSLLGDPSKVLAAYRASFPEAVWSIK